VFMYIVFICFSFRLLFKLIDSDNSLWNCLSFKWFINFYVSICTLIINFFKK
jgi:hypothetical protein